MAARLDDAIRKQTAAKASQDPWKNHQAEARVRRFRDLLHNWKQPVDPTPIEVQVEIWKLGDVAIVSIPGEPFAEIGVAVRNASPLDYTMFCGYSDGIGGDYLPMTCEYDQGGYEVERTPYGRQADKKLIAETIALFKQLPSDKTASE